MGSALARETPRRGSLYLAVGVAEQGRPDYPGLLMAFDSVND